MDHSVEPQQEAGHALTRAEVSAILRVIREELMKGDIDGAANVLGVLAERIDGDDEIMRREHAEAAGWRVAIH